MIRICSFNVNSVRTRIEPLLGYLESQQPEIVGLQETKVVDSQFPFEPFGDQGYDVQVFGQKAYHGVALLSSTPPSLVQRGFSTDTEDDQKRLIIGYYDIGEAKPLVVINGYFPQGESREHPTKFPAKAKFYRDLMTLLDDYSPQDPIVIMGDFNISPEDKDIGIGEQNAKRWLRTGKCSFLPEEREWIGKMRDWGFFDSYRTLNPERDDQFSWFDYRSGGFNDDPQRGLRIDQIWITAPLKAKLKDVGIDYELRAQERPSDHCLIWADFDLDLK